MLVLTYFSGSAVCTTSSQLPISCSFLMVQPTNSSAVPFTSLKSVTIAMDYNMLSMLRKGGATDWREQLTLSQASLDYENLENLKTAKYLNPCQAWWDLFFTRFNFMLLYRPGSKNTKAKSLSCIYPSETLNQGHESIFLPSCFIQA